MTQLLRFCLQVAQTAQHAVSILLCHRHWLNIPATGLLVTVNIRLEVTPWVEEGGFVSRFAGESRRIFNGVLLFTFITHNANETKDNLVISQWINIRQVIATTAVSSIITTLQAAIILRPVGVVAEYFCLIRVCFINVIYRISDASRSVAVFTHFSSRNKTVRCITGFCQGVALN